jgi:hypothetical protein
MPDQPKGHGTAKPTGMPKPQTPFPRMPTSSPRWRRNLWNLSRSAWMVLNSLRQGRDARNSRRQGSDAEEPQSASGVISVSIFLADEGIHEQVETAVEQWLATADVSIDAQGEPVIGSWFRWIVASWKAVTHTPVGREVLLTATHVADSRLVQGQDAYITATLLQNVGQVLQALQPTKDAVVRAGALLIVKIEGVVQVHQLTAAQQAILDHRPRLAASPAEIIAALQLTESDLQEAGLPSASEPVGRDGTAAASGN